MSDRSAGHCGRHRVYRCHHCETHYPDDYHDGYTETTPLEDALEQELSQMTDDEIRDTTPPEEIKRIADDWRKALANVKHALKGAQGESE